ncbi:aldehyde dehydrogenase family protein [Brevibacterium aurantiacum]|uniref:Aldehyde dehydrogenase family protein n=1 Tax=Brevibacterium aurantiacum TaxID=273384 RepID=A0A556C5C3_BREAU|nr:aldehyde dehydrogenase family protein [Brevibacterium aurantiacum]TSI12218.1 aldehyde dehydrogenase family protein [Brevibacterium aurantiacum]
MTTQLTDTKTTTNTDAPISTPPISGSSIVAGTKTPGEGGTARAVNPATGEELEPEFTLLSEEQVSAAIARAHTAFASYRSISPTLRAKFLTDIAMNIEAAADVIVERAGQETGLPAGRLNGEITRTANQLRLFASVVLLGDAHGVRIDPALPDRAPLPRPDIRQRQVPLGPVAVFGASNFPLAFSTAGGDTASALAAGCPVIVKAHNAHPGTNELVGAAISRAVADNDLNPGVFSLVYGSGAQVGQQLAADPRIAAVGFTGSRTAGLALSATAAARAVPVPVYAEMSSINPVFVLPGAIADDVAEVARGFFTSVTGSSGQLCTSPGILFVPTGARGDALTAHIAEEFSEATGQTMLTPSIAEAWQRGVDQLAAQPGVTALAQGADGKTLNAPGPAVFTVSVKDFTSNAELQNEIFGSAALIVRYETTDQLAPVVTELEGQLTATLQMSELDSTTAHALVSELELKVGRIIVNGWPTGVDVGHAMIHGGPFPATSAPQTTSVGATAIERFLRPVAYQNIPDAILPSVLQQSNPWRIGRAVDGRYTPGQGGDQQGDSPANAASESVSEGVRRRLGDLGFDLPEANPASYSYKTVTVAGDLAFVSGQIAKQGGEVPVQGVVGDDLSVEDGIAAAQLCAVNLIAQLETNLGLENVESIAKLNVYVASPADFSKHPIVAEGASKLLVDALGEAGRHARTALGVPRLPANSPVEIEAVIKLKG